MTFEWAAMMQSEQLRTCHQSTKMMRTGVALNFIRRYGSFLAAVRILAFVFRTGFETAANGTDDFEKHVRPVLVERCQPCHGGEKSKGGLRLDSRAAMLKGGDSGPAVVPGKPAESLMAEVIAYTGELKMPPKGKLKDQEIQALTGWIAAGATWPEADESAKQASASSRTASHRDWWAFRPLRSPEVPKIRPQPVNPIDAFIDSKLIAAGIAPALQADRRTLLRRTSFDLTGLPPTAEEVETFENDGSPAAFEKVADRLLASPAYGQRWARHWLDVVRYADYHDGNPKARNPVCEPLEAWRYRDWVVDSLNRDLPYDQFVIHQIAGDLLPPPNGRVPYADGLVATTFLVNGAWDRGDADKEKMVSDMVDDQIDTVGKAFMGLTIGCARCHDHKFDPVSNRDYYALAGIFYSTRMLKELGTKGGEITLQRRPLVPPAVVEKRERQLKQIAGLESILAEMDKKTPKPPPDDPTRQLLAETRDRIRGELLPEPPMALAVSEGGVPGGLFPGVQDVPIHIRGSYTRLGAVVPRAMPAFFAGDGQQPIASGSGRKELAAWVASPGNPLTARVIVNRVWQWHFGAGLVRTPNNFGMNSEKPSHPELLDWLAAKFIEDGWSLKKLHRRIILTRAYQRSSAAGEKARAADPENRLLGRFTPRRLEAEAIRDAMLAAAGSLDLALLGPATHEIDTPRRSLYLQTARWDRGNFGMLFDAANPDASVERRDVSTVATQALFLLNHTFVKTQAKRLAERSLPEKPGDSDARIRRLFRLTLARNETPAEAEVARGLLDTMRRTGRDDPWADLAHVLLCGNELVTID